ncbi:MAG TPA: MTH1187 family thiamine-binding protein [Planctomycetota bacterium]|jgi:uncharacterized protein (TIGR00106 family)
MLFELSIIPLGNSSHISDEIAEAVKLIESSGCRYKLTPTSTCIEGQWDEIMPLIRRCHEQIRQHSPHVLTTITIEDEDGAENKLAANVQSVERAVGHQLVH